MSLEPEAKQIKAGEPAHLHWTIDDRGERERDGGRGEKKVRSKDRRTGFPENCFVRGLWAAWKQPGLRASKSFLNTVEHHKPT